MKKSVKRLMSCVLAMLFLVGTVFGNAGTLTAEASEDGGGTAYSGKIVYHLTDGKEDAGTGQEGTQEATGETVEGGEPSEGGEGQEIPTDVTSEETGKTIEQAYSFVWDGVDEDLEAAIKSAAEIGTFSFKKVSSVLDEYPEIKNEGYVAAGWKVKKVNPESGEENNKVIRNAWDIPAELYRENQGGTIELELAWGKAADVIYYMNDGTEASYTSPAIAGEKYTVSGFEDIAGAAGFQTPENMEFTGWNTSWDGTGENYAAGSEVTLNEVGLGLYAQWQNIGTEGTEDTGTTEPVTEPQTSDGGTGSTEPGTEPQTEPSNVGDTLGNGLPDFHTITFDGTGAAYNVPEAVKALLAEGVYTTTIPDVTPELEGYSFNGWRDDEWNYYNPGDPVTVSTDVTLYADWTKTYKVTFEGNGQTGRNVPEPIIVREGDSLTLDETIPVPERDSYIFEGWSYNDTLYNTGDTIGDITSDITLKASWKAVPVIFSITFDGQGATGGVPGNDSVEEGSPYTIPSDVPEKTGYTFKGWSDGQNTYNAGNELTNIDRNIAFTAVWEEIPKTYYNITFDGQGATGGIVPQGASVEEGTSYTIPSEIPEKAGYTFKGWSDGQNTYNAGTELTNIAGNIPFTAVWEEIPKTYYNITFDGQGATGGVVPQGASVEEGSSYTIPAEVPEKTGYTFEGWSDGQNTYNAGTELTNIAGNIAFTAVWEEIPKTYYNITFDGQGATGGVVPQGASVEEGSSYTIPGDVPEKAGYTFKGWSDGQNMYNAGTELTNIAGNIVFTAVWEEIPKTYHDITFDGKGAKEGTVPQNASVEDGTPYTIPDMVPEQDGFNFKGWSDGTNTYQPGQYIENITGQLALSAVWEAKAPEHVPVVPDPANSTVSGIKSGSVFTVGDKPSFEVKGAGMDNNAPGKGDVRYVPSDWTAGNNTATWQNGPYKGTLDLGKGDYTLQINLKKQVYDGAQWTADGTTASIKINFTIKEKETEALPETKTVSLSSGQTVISADDMNKLIADNAKQNIVINNGSVSFTFLKGTMQAVEGVTNYDFGTSLNSGTNYEKAKSLAGKQFVEFIHFNHDGQLPGKAIIRFPLDQAHAGALCYYYYYNPEKEGFTLVQEVTIGSDGYGQIEQEHCSDYVLTDSKLLKTIQGVTQISNPTNVPKTGDNTQIIIWIVILAVALVCIVIVGVIFVRKRKK